MHTYRASILVVLISLISLCNGARGQDTEELILTVTQLAGQNVYLDGGSVKGITEGDTLVTASDDRLLVIAVSRNQSIANFAGTPFPVTRGQLLRVRVLKGAAEVPEEVGEVVEEAEEAVSIMEQPEVGQRAEARRKREGVEVDGRLLLSFSGLLSETRIRSGNVPAVSRTYLTPAVNLNATVKNLPSDMKLHVNIRSDYRYQSYNSVSPDNSFRAYRLSLEKDLPFGVVQFGRFYNRMTRRGGYWDGVSFLVGSRKRGVGGAVGFMPERSNEGFSTQLPRFSVFGQYETPRGKPVIYRGSVAYNEIQPSSSSLLQTHRFASLEQRIDWSLVSLRQDIQVDQDPAVSAVDGVVHAVW